MYSYLQFWRAALSVAASALLITPGGAAPVISEIMASNDGVIFDEDGDSSDWIEIYNPDNTPVDLSGWYLTDNAAASTKWRFPNGVTLGPKQMLLVWASSKDRDDNPAALHTNFSLSAEGEYLALVAPDGTTRVSEFAPAFPALRENESYGLVFEGTTLLGENAEGQVLVPTDDSLGMTWTHPGFTPGAGWIIGKAAFGFGMLTPGFFVEERLSSVPLSNITQAEAVLNGTNALDLLTAVRPVVNFVGPTGTDGHFEDGLPMLHSGDRSNFAIRATATLVVPEAGEYTFCVNSDDGFRLRVNNRQVAVFSGGRGAADSFGTVQLPAGHVPLVLTYFEGEGSDEVELSAAKGRHTSFSSAFFRLVGDTANGGLAVLTDKGGEGAIVQTNLSAAMQGVNASAYVRLPFTVANPSAFDTLELEIGYNDGFVAYLNGVEVARRNAPETLNYNSTATAERPMLESLQFERINISEHLLTLTVGTNVLAVHGLNRAADDSSFYVAPRLYGSSLGTEGRRFFRQATPGRANTTTPSLGRVAPPEFSVTRGYYTTPQTLTLTSATPGATIRYTTNGSTPTRTNGQVYTGPITIDKTTVVRAAAFLDGYEDNVIVTHTYLFLADVIYQGVNPATNASVRPSPEWPAPGTVNGQRIDYGMDQRIVKHTNPQLGGEEQTIAALRALPAVCLTTDLPNLFNPQSGIYVNANSRGRTWERPASVELIGDANTTEGGFGAPCGVRIRGGYSRSNENPKHAFRLYFRGEYGLGRLRYPVFGSQGASEFDKIDVQCSQNYSWSFEGNSNHNALREIWSRDTQLDMGQLGTRGRFVHLFLNGVYWGLYQLQERAEASFGASYLGGSKEDYDVIKHAAAPGGYTTEATDGYFVTMPDGSPSAWKQLWDATRAAYWINLDKDPANPTQTRLYSQEEKLAAYFKPQGLLADGKTRSGDPVLLDVDNLIDYMIISIFARNADAPLVSGGDRPNNFYSLRNRLGDLGFVHIQHDGEHSLNAAGANDRWGPFQHPISGNWNNINYSNPQFIHQDLSVCPEYKMRWADRLQKYLFNGGVLTREQNQARLDRRAAEIEPAIIAESARWGDSKVSTPLNANHWRSARTATRNWFNNRTTSFLNEAKAASRGFYPSINPPVFNQRGGEVPPGFQLTLTNPNTTGTIYYTTDGSDPRPVGGGFVSTILVPEFATASYLVPSETNGGSTLTREQWTTIAAPPNAAAWSEGPLGFGFAPARTTNDFRPFIKTDVQQAMQPSGGTANGTLYVRLPFTMTEAQIAQIDQFLLRVRFDDAYIAYLNGTEVARRGINSGFVPAWNSVSGVVRSDALAVAFDDVVVTQAKQLLVPGQNMLAFHVMNFSATNTDFLFSPQVEYNTLGPGVGTPYTGPIAINGRVVVKARVLDGTVWSALDEAVFTAGVVPATAEHLVVSEFNYAPLGPQNEAEQGYEGRDFEFIELYNRSSVTVDLAGCAFTTGITYAFPAEGVVVPPGGYLVIASNPVAFAKRYPHAPEPLGPWSGNLNNAGETVTLLAADQSIIKSFTYSPDVPWPVEADGAGASLVLIDPAANPDHNVAANWRASTVTHGTPGTGESPGGGYAVWKAAYGDLADDADPDGDGLSLFAEYALGGSPSAPDFHRLPVGALQTLVIDGTPGVYFTLSVTRPASVNDVAYEVETSTTLQDGSWSANQAILVSETPDPANGTVTMLFRSAQPVTAGEPVFLRLRLKTAF